MFKILSKESNIFSIPVYIGILLLVIIAINIFEFNPLNVISTAIAFVGVALGYFTFNSVGLNHKTNIPLFIYTLLNISLYPKVLDIGISWTILSNSVLIFILTYRSENNGNRKIYVLVGSILTLNYIMLPTIWPMSIFFILHILGTSKRVALNLFRFILGGILVAISYFSMAYFLGLNSWDENYLPYTQFSYSGIGKNLLLLTPVALLLIYSVLDYFMQYNKTSRSSKFKYFFLLLLVFTQMIIIVMYMGLAKQYLLIIALPVSIIISRALYYMNKNIYQEIAIWVLFISLIAYRLFQHIQF